MGGFDHKMVGREIIYLLNLFPDGLQRLIGVDFDPAFDGVVAILQPDLIIYFSLVVNCLHQIDYYIYSII